jgi:hypothetical protein
MKASSLTIALTVGLLASSACAVKTTSTDVSPGADRAATCTNAVEVFASRADVPSSYRELAWIEAEGNSVWTTDNQIRTEMQKRAAEAGANGLIANPVDQNKAGVNVIGEALGAHTATAKASGMAIWIPANAAKTRQTCGA